MMTLKFLQILTEPFCFSTGTMGAAHLKMSIGDITPEATNLLAQSLLCFLTRKEQV